MATSGQLRVKDVRAALRLVGECRDLAYDPQQWGRHMSQGLCRLVGARVGNGGEVSLVRSHGVIQGATYYNSGFEPWEHELYLDFLRTYAINRHPLAEAFARWGTHRPRAGHCRTRKQVISDGKWYRSIAYDRFHRVIRIDHCLASLVQLGGDGWFSFVALHRAAGERDLSERQQRLLHLFHTELGQLIGPVLVSAGDPFSPTRLPPRVRETLSCLLEGDGEKQAAARMGLSIETIHQYVKALYRHYQVENRAELLIRVLRRTRPGG